MGRQTGISARSPDQFVVRPGLDHMALIYHENAVGPANRRQAMRNHDDCPPAGQARERRLHARLAFGVQRACRLVEEKNRRFGQESPGKRDSLALPA
jgi:hypothetical protein